MKVFISSTYKDLIDYRAAAIRAVEGTNYQAGKMEVFGARSDEPVEVCLKEVLDSDLFIGIYALRYGYIPDGSDISITEMENAHAKKLGKVIYCFLLDDENQPWLKKWIEGDPGKSKLESFKKQIQKDHVCDYFTTPDDLRAKVAGALSHFVAYHDDSSNSNNVCPLPKPTGNSLPREGFFVGREEERKTIAAALSPESRTWGALIDGPGGIGKTALAIKAAHEAPEGLFERKIFISAKVRELHSDGEKPLTDFARPTYLAMLDELGRELGEENLERLEPDERSNVLRLTLAGKKALIVFDNLETLPEEERTRLFQFLSRLPEGNKAIVTSRRRTDVDARIVRLDRLSSDEAMELIAELAKKYPRLERASEKERDDLYGMTHGNPLLIRWIAGQLGLTGSQCHTIADACAFIEKAPKGNDPLEYIFGDLLETFTENETLVLAALTFFTQPAKLKWLAQMTDLPERTAETALDDLTDRAILISDLEERTYYLPPLAAQFIKTRRPEAVIQTGDALVNRAYALAMQYGGDENFDGFRTLDAEWAFISAALPRLLVGDNERLQVVCGQLHRFLDFTGKWDERILLSEKAELSALANSDKENAGWRAYHAGTTYYRSNQPDKVLDFADRAAKHWKESGFSHEKSLAIQLRGFGHRINKDYPAAIAAHREELEIQRSISPESGSVANVLNSLAEAERENKDYHAAEHDYLEALRLARKFDDQALIVLCIGNLGALALAQAQWDKAESLAREALPLAERVGRQEMIARDCNTIAKAIFKQNKNLEEALIFAQRAVEVFTRSRHPNLSEAKQTLAEIEKTMSEE